MSKEFRQKNLPEWMHMLNSFFDSDVPEVMQWDDKKEIANVLDQIGYEESKVLNHMFMPNGGGLDLASAAIAQEKGCIELFTDGGSKILKPRKLTFRSFDKSGDWSYFYLELAELNPLFAFDEKIDLEEDLNDVSELLSTYEYLTLFPNGNYEDYSLGEQGFIGYDENGYEIPLPHGTRTVNRYLKGSIVIFAKSSIYNLYLSDTYDGRHNKMNEVEFANYIKKLKLSIEERLKTNQK